MNYLIIDVRLDNIEDRLKEIEKHLFPFRFCNHDWSDDTVVDDASDMAIMGRICKHNCGAFYYNFAPYDIMYHDINGNIKEVDKQP